MGSDEPGCSGHQNGESFLDWILTEDPKPFFPSETTHEPPVAPYFHHAVYESNCAKNMKPNFLLELRSGSSWECGKSCRL
ncbi:hypothetical protein L2E82_29856 [Cichorium intybus]|uniref:Uncharacterized protein n=1 Tax=Cichorium intybus TaxID=13427 RepID=A0ACB9CZE8_CICIN|nr:hypothetical protein L2E82_29856 [Cichorium intybus]